MTVTIQKAILIILITLLVIACILYFTLQKSSEPEEILLLKSYRNKVALYNGEEMLRSYDDIVLNTLPQTDIENFKNGIAVKSIEDAEIFLENFDS